MSKYLDAAERLHSFLRGNFWRNDALIGPDNGVGFNRRVGRFVKSNLDFVPWNDDYYYMQAQGYWVMANWQLYQLTASEIPAELATRCSYTILRRQEPAGYWTYPHPGWAGHIATVEGIFAALGMLASYERTRDATLLEGAERWYRFLTERTGFVEAEGGSAINYFADAPRGLVPNNTTLALAFLARLAQATANGRYLEHCPAMISFLTSVQTESGEFPYSMKDPSGNGRQRVHYECYQYHAFQLQDLAMYFDATQDTRVLEPMRRVADFLALSVQEDGATQFDCTGRAIRKPYNTAAIAAALGIARRLGLRNSLQAENRAYEYVLDQQRSDGGFDYSSREFGFLADKRDYPRPMAMILYHLLLKASDTSAQSCQVWRSD